MRKFNYVGPGEILTLTLHNIGTTPRHNGMGPMCGGDLILTLHHHNNCTTTPHMRVDPSVWDPPSCEGLLCSCCISVVNLTFSMCGSHSIVLWCCVIVV
jgi:hypothetical protein